MNDEELLVAAAKGDAAGVRDALQGGAALEARDSRGRTALLLAAAADHVESAEVLVKAGADPDARDFQHDTAFLVTGSTGSVAMLRALLAAGPDPSLTNRHGEVALIPACARGHAAYVREVLRLTAIKVDHAGRGGRTGLLEAIVSGDGSRPYREIVRLLAAAGADVNLADGDGVSPLRHALDAGQEEIAALLRANGAR
ncbi:ankyrin repeat domain-containing protein [Actinomadura viridis]|uniref:ankyrin repeat domain-containing protein n=1 Tax=Actinomadura viridis TaxID=58110 RepID=UPI0036CB3743